MQQPYILSPPNYTSHNKMVREGDHMSGGGMVVPLLQERFRQLQRMKELRQEKEMLRMLSESERAYTPPINHDQLVLPPPKPHCQLSLSLWPDSPPGITTNLSKSLFAHAPLLSTLPINLHQNSASDIDTSLRL